VMMICYVAVPARLIGGRPVRSRRDKLTASALGATLSATVCTPPYLLGRLGILMLGSPVLRIPGVFVLVVGFTLHAGATGADMVRSSFQTRGRRPPPGWRSSLSPAPRRWLRHEG